MSLTLNEQETIINFNNGEDTAYIYTRSKPWMRHMEQVLGLSPTQTHSYAREYECPKAWIKKPRKPRKLSEEQRLRVSQRLQQNKVLNKVVPCAQVVFGG